MFNICYANEQVIGFFYEVENLLRLSLEDLGQEVSTTVSCFVKNKINIVLGYQELPYQDSLQEFSYIPYQLEQLVDSRSVWNDNIAALLRGAWAVWDYSPENIAFLSKQGIAARHLPVGFHPKLARIGESAQKDYDVLFYGGINPRREKILKALLHTGCRVKILQGVFGQQRDAYIRRSSMVLNIHYYHMMLCETVRLGYLLNNAVFVLSEESRDSPWPHVRLATAKYENLVPSVAYFLEHPELREKTRQKTAQAFAAHDPMPRLLQPLLAEACRRAGRAAAWP